MRGRHVTAGRGRTANADAARPLASPRLGRRPRRRCRLAPISTPVRRRCRRPMVPRRRRLGTIIPPLGLDVDAPSLLEAPRPARRRPAVVDALRALGHAPRASRPVAVALGLAEAAALARAIRADLAQRADACSALAPVALAAAAAAAVEYQRRAVVTHAFELQALAVAAPVGAAIAFDLCVARDVDIPPVSPGSLTSPRLTSRTRASPHRGCAPDDPPASVPRRRLWLLKLELNRRVSLTFLARHTRHPMARARKIRSVPWGFEDWIFTSDDEGISRVSPCLLRASKPGTPATDHPLLRRQGQARGGGAARPRSRGRKAKGYGLVDATDGPGDVLAPGSRFLRIDVPSFALQMATPASSGREEGGGVWLRACVRNNVLCYLPEVGTYREYYLTWLFYLL